MFNRNRSFNTVMAALLSIVLMATIAYAYTRDWDNADPIDHTLNSKWPAEIREVMTDVEERMDDIANGFTSGDTVTDYNKIPLNNRVADPTNVGDTGILYTKDASGKAELFFIDEDGNVIQLTTVGSLNETAACESVYPVGHIYISTVSTNPNTLLGCGTWAASGEGRVLVGVGTSDAAYSLDGTGGASTVTLTGGESGTSAHPHNIPLQIWAGQDNGTYTAGTNHTNSAGTDTTDNSSEANADDAHQNMPPYLVVHIWERTS